MTDTPPTILCATDLDRSGDDAARLATAYAKHVGGRPHLVHAVEDAVPFEALDPHVRAAAEALEERLRARHQAAEEKLDALAIRCAGMVETKATLKAGRPWEVTLELAEQVDPELIVVGPHVRSESWAARVGERLLGTTAKRVVRHAQRRVLVASGDIEPAEKALQTGELRILVGVDFAEGGAAALAEARRVGGDQATLVLAHVLQDPFAPGDQPIDWGKLRVEWTQQLEERLGDSVRDLPNATEAHVGSGLPGAALAELAKEHDAQLITVGAHAGGRLSRFLLGSTAERVLVDAPVPVLVVPPAGEADA